MTFVTYVLLKRGDRFDLTFHKTLAEAEEAIASLELQRSVVTDDYISAYGIYFM